MSKYNGGVKSKSSAKKRRERALARLVVQIGEKSKLLRVILRKEKVSDSEFSEMLRKEFGGSGASGEEYADELEKDIIRCNYEMSTLKTRI
jgi:hypothetical protein